MEKAFYSLVLLVGMLAVCNASYRYYYTRPSYRALFSKIEQLERDVEAIKNRPVHIHIAGNEKDNTANTNGANVYVNLNMDGHDQPGAKGDLSDNEYSYANCRLQTNVNAPNDISGTVYLRQKRGADIQIMADIGGWPNLGMFGFHVHEVADYSNGCNSFGGHYNPHGKNHASPGDHERHVGDWGNLDVKSLGEDKYRFTDHLASLFGEHSIIGRGIVIHAGQDDLGKGGNAGSLKHGNAGARLACCTIGHTKSGPWVDTI